MLEKTVATVSKRWFQSEKNCDFHVFYLLNIFRPFFSYGKNHVHKFGFHVHVYFGLSQ